MNHVQTINTNYSGYVAIAVFDDRIEIQSYGRLPNGISVEQLSGPHRSKPTNPLIAEAFHRTGAVEIWGRGTNRVITMCMQHGAAAPIFEERSGFLIVTFKAQLVAEAFDVSADMTGKMTGKMTDLIIQIMSMHPEMTLTHIAKAIGKSLSTVERAVARLVREGRLKRTGSRKEGYWELRAISEETTDKVLPDHSTVSEGSLEELADKVAGKMADETTIEISESIIQTLGKNPEMTLAQVSSAIGKSTHTVERAAIKLVEEGKLKHDGPRKGGHWTVVNKISRLSEKRK